MKKIISLSIFILLTLNSIPQNQIPIQYEELNAIDFSKSIEMSDSICLLPFGILEKHGPHMPFGTDLLMAREFAIQAAKQEYCVVFPQYYFGQINEARHQPGAIAYTHTTIWNLLQETLDELSRNGFKKIIIVNEHGGNNDFLKYFCMSQLENPKDYVVVVFDPTIDSAFNQNIKGMINDADAGHAGVDEASQLQAFRPDLVHPERAAMQSGKDLNRLSSIKNQYTGIWWYAKFPNHYGGNASKPNLEYGKLVNEEIEKQLVELIKTVKHTNQIKELQQKFYNDAKNPLKTSQ